MDHAELEDLAVSLADSLTTSAMTIRTQGVVSGCCASVTVEGKVEFALIPPHMMDHRIELITQEVRKHDAVLFVFVYDGYFTQFGLDPCAECAGAGCVHCRGIGKQPVMKSEAIHTVTKSAWGFERLVSHPYRVEGGFVVEQVAPSQADQHRAAVIDSYSAVFKHKTVH